jgi:hypothetical protein
LWTIFESIQGIRIAPAIVTAVSLAAAAGKKFLTNMKKGTPVTTAAAPFPQNQQAQ